MWHSKIYFVMFQTNLEAAPKISGCPDNPCQHVMKSEIILAIRSVLNHLKLRTTTCRYKCEFQCLKLSAERAKYLGVLSTDNPLCLRCVTR